MGSSSEQSEGSDGFFKDGYNVDDNNDFVTGDPSLYNMPHLDWDENENRRKRKDNEVDGGGGMVRDRKTYIRMDPKALARREARRRISKSKCEYCETKLSVTCKCCTHRGHLGEKSERVKKSKGTVSGEDRRKKSNGGRSKQSKPSDEDEQYRRMEAAATKFGSEKFGQRLAMAASMFAAGYAMAGMVNSIAKGEFDAEVEEDE